MSDCQLNQVNLAQLTSSKISKTANYPPITRFMEVSTCSLDTYLVARSVYTMLHQPVNSRHRTTMKMQACDDRQWFRVKFKLTPLHVGLYTYTHTSEGQWITLHISVTSRTIWKVAISVQIISVLLLGFIPSLIDFKCEIKNIIFVKYVLNELRKHICTGLHFLLMRTHSLCGYEAKRKINTSVG